MASKTEITSFLNKELKNKATTRGITVALFQAVIKAADVAKVKLNYAQSKIPSRPQ
jgi:hypothetical protein